VEAAEPAATIIEPARTADDEARLLAEASGRVEVRLVDEGDEPAEPKKNVRGVVSEETVLVPGVLSELNRRFRPPDEDES